MLKKLLILGLVWMMHLSLVATEGMWLPLLLQQLNEAEMQEMGMRLTAEDIYSVNKGSLKDAIVRFGGGCTGEIISDQGLLLTNHHCGYRQIQSHSSLQNNYLEDGFWAASQADELPNPGLGVTFIVRIEDVSATILEGVNDDLSESDREARIQSNMAKLRSSAKKEKYQEVLIRPFFAGNQFFLFITETFTDVRLVGAPPSSIGKFGADTDNWVWPRHTGDFSLFRVYAGPDNKPADYSPNNKPYKPKHFLPISLKGVKEGDFTMVFGFPGRTNEYLPATAVQQQVDIINPARIAVRDRSLAVLDKAMRADPQVKIQYASKQSGIANAWKKWIGESQGVKQTDGIGRKQELETAFNFRLNKDLDLKNKYGDILPQLNELYTKRENYAKMRAVSDEVTFRNIELFRQIRRMERFRAAFQRGGLSAIQGRLPGLQSGLAGFYKDYRPEVDQEVFASVIEEYFNNIPKEYISSYAVDQLMMAGSNPAELAKAVYGKSFLRSGEEALALLEKDPETFFQKLEEDYAVRLVTEMVNTDREKVQMPYQEIQDQIVPLQRRYMAALMAVFPERRFYPDANSTMRVSYGQVAGYSPKDGLRYEPQTYLEGVMEKYVPGDYEFDVPAKLIALYKGKKYGPYGENQKMPVCFIGSNHTTGGNSGSPVIDADGNLIGLNFDRVWEGTMSDINYDPSICRNIMVDVRYILFLIDKFADAGHLVEEMTLVKN